MKTKLFIFIIAISFLTSCRNDFSRETAKDLIIQKYNFPHIETTRLLKDHLFKTETMSGITYGSIYFKDKFDTLLSEGLITLNERQEGDDPRYTIQYFTTVSLTEEGKKYLVNEDKWEYELKGSDISFGEVTDIKMNEKHASVEYYLKRTNTPFGKVLSSNKNIGKNQDFTLYDDGWGIGEREFQRESQWQWQCTKCGTTVNQDLRPLSSSCPKGDSHQWKQHF